LNSGENINENQNSSKFKSFTTTFPRTNYNIQSKKSSKIAKRGECNHL